MMHSEGPTSVQRTLVFRIPLAADKQRAFFNAFKARVRSALNQASCKIAGESGSSGANAVSVIGYTHDPVAGTIQICLGDLGNDRASIVLTMQEQRAAAHSFGLENSMQ